MNVKYKAMGTKRFLKVPVLDERNVAPPLNSVDALVYAYLVYRSKKGAGSMQTKICTSLRLDRNAGRDSLKRLSTVGLVTVVGQQWFAVKPGPANSFFRTQHEAEGDWSDRFIYDRVYLPVSSAVLSVRANLLYWHLFRLGEAVENMPGHLRVGGARNKYFTDRYLATALNCDRKTSHACLRRLEDLGLLRTCRYSKGFAVAIFPLKGKEGLWRDHWQPRSKAVPALTVHELFDAPSPAVVENEIPYESAVRRRIRPYGISGSLGEELIRLIVEEEINPDTWQPMLKKAQATHFTNREDGKTTNIHCGFLFRHLLVEYLETRDWNRTHNPQPRITTSDEMRLGDALSSLQLDHCEYALLMEAIDKTTLTSDYGDLIPCNLEMDNAAELALKAAGNKKVFKKSLEGLLFGEHILKAKQYQWYREWSRKNGEILPDTRHLQTLGIAPHAVGHIRLRLRSILDDKIRNEDHGRFTARVNILAMVAGWQMGLHKCRNEQESLIAAARQVAVEAGLVEAESEDELQDLSHDSGPPDLHSLD